VQDVLIDKSKKAYEAIISKSDNLDMDQDDIPEFKDALTKIVDLLIEKKYEYIPRPITELLLDPTSIRMYCIDPEKYFASEVKRIGLLTRELTDENEYNDVIAGDILLSLSNLTIALILGYCNDIEELDIKKHSIIDLLESIPNDHYRELISKVFLSEFDKLNDDRLKTLFCKLREIAGVKNENDQSE
jgi:hypothetical protein